MFAKWHKSIRTIGFPVDDSRSTRLVYAQPSDTKFSVSVTRLGEAGMHSSPRETLGDGVGRGVADGIGVAVFGRDALFGSVDVRVGSGVDVCAGVIGSVNVGVGGGVGVGVASTVGVTAGVAESGGVALRGATGQVRTPAGSVWVLAGVGSGSKPKEMQ
jgi:hypothetical protein